MRILRCGAQRFHGWKEIASRFLTPEQIKGPTRKHSSETTIELNSVKDESSDNAFYNYAVGIEYDEVLMLMSALAHRLKNNDSISDEIRPYIKKHLNELLFLTGIASGALEHTNPTSSHHEPNSGDSL